MKTPYEILLKAMQDNNMDYVDLITLFPIKKNESGKRYAHRIIAMTSIASKIKTDYEMQKIINRNMPEGSYLRYMFDREKSKGKLPIELTSYI